MNKTHIYLIVILLAIILISGFISNMLEPIYADNIEGLVPEKQPELSSDLKTAITNYPEKPGQGIRDLKTIHSKLNKGMYPEIQNDLRTKISSYLPNMINAEEQLAKHNVLPLDVKNTIDKIMSTNPKINPQNPQLIKAFGSTRPVFQVPKFVPPQPPKPPVLPQPPKPPVPPQPEKK